MANSERVRANEKEFVKLLRSMTREQFARFLDKLEEEGANA